MKKNYLKYYSATKTAKKTAKKKATKKKPLLNAAEKTTLREARKILKRLTRKWEKLEDEFWDTPQGGIGISAAEDKFLAELEPLHIDFDGCTATIDLEN